MIINKVTKKNENDTGTVFTFGGCIYYSSTMKSVVLAVVPFILKFQLIYHFINIYHAFGYNAY